MNRMVTVQSSCHGDQEIKFLYNYLMVMKILKGYFLQT